MKKRAITTAIASIPIGHCTERIDGHINNIDALIFCGKFR